MLWQPLSEKGQNNLPTIGLSPLPGGYSKATDFGFLDKFAAFHPGALILQFLKGIDF
jgi:hypothetical protein